MRCGGIVLCGGRSTRMGMPKAALPFGPETMLARVVRLLGQVVEPIVVVAAPGQALDRFPSEVLVARDLRQGCGPLEGIRAGLGAMAGRADAAYVTGCDVPLLAGGFVRRMIELLGEHEIAVPIEGDFFHPLAALYRTSVLPEIESLLAADRLRPAFLFERTDTLAVPVERFRDVDPQLSTLKNLNRPEDYFGALGEIGFDAPPEVTNTLRGHADDSEPEA